MYPEWLQPAKPDLTGTVREHSHADEFRIARLEYDAARVAEKALAEERAKEGKERGLAKAHAMKRAQIAAECLARGETMLEREARMRKEKYWRSQIRKLRAPKL